jgi:hypothetical protein
MNVAPDDTHVTTIGRRKVFVNLQSAGARAALASLLLFGAASALPLSAQNSGGPVALPPPTYEPLPATSRPTHTQPVPAAAPANTPAPAQSASTGVTDEPPSIPVDQIVKQFSQHEAEFRKERDSFTYTQTFLVQTIDDRGNPDGEYRMTTDITYTSDGKRNENVTFAPPPTIERVTLSQQDFDDLRNVQPFVLTTEELPKYDIKYVGRQKVDEIGTYVFDVGPKTIEKNQRYFQGRIWVDDRDLEIVKTNGKAVPDIRKKNGDENVFPRFETYRENIEGPYWFPTYTHSDDILHFTSGDVHLRMTVRYSDYKRFRSTVRVIHSEPVAPGDTPPPPH